MTTTTKTPELVRPNGSHWFEPMSSHGGKEELYPIVELELPRVGLVRASFKASRYVASSWDESTGTSTPVWTDWNIYLTDVRAPDPDRPDLPHLGRDVAGIGPATRKKVDELGEPLIRQWLAGDGYKRSRQQAARHYIVRKLEAPRPYTLERARDELNKVADELNADDFSRIRRAIRHLELALEELEGPDA